MLHLCFLLMGNLRFSYIQDKAFLINEGYRPALDLLRRYPKAKAEILCSGYTTNRLLREAPDVVEGIRRGVAEKRLGISTNGFEHAFLPTLSLFAQEKLIAKGVELDRKAFGVQPQGFWASDCCWDSTVIRPLVDNGVRWAYIGPWIQNSNPGGPFFHDWREYDPYDPVTVEAPEGASIAGFPTPYAQYDILLEKNLDMRRQFFQGLRERAEQKDGFAFIQMDFEFPAVLKSPMWAREPHIPLERFMEELLSIPHCEFGFASEFLNAHPPAKKVCLRESPGCDWLKPWDGGCRKLDMTCRQAEEYLLAVEDLLAARPHLATPAITRTLNGLWERFLLSMQSEPRMTNFTFMWDATDGKNQCRDQCLIYPPDEMVLEAMNDATATLRGARELKRELLRKTA